MDWFIGHLIGDYLLQNDWMGSNKKEHWFPCFVHCLVYTGAVALCTWWPWWTWPLIFVSHYLLDGTLFVQWYLEMIGRPKFMKPPWFPWSWVIIDNTLHLVTLWLIQKLVAGVG